MTGTPIQRSKTTAIVVAAGRGERVGSGVAKQFRILAGKAVVAHAIDALMSHQAVDNIVLVVGADQQALAKSAVGERLVNIVPGGATRRQSVLAGLEYVAQTGAADYVLIHDAARPFLPGAVIDRLLDAVEIHQGAIPVLPVVDTLARGADMLGDLVDRAMLNRVQTPQVFRFLAILATHREWAGDVEPTDDAQMLLASGHDVLMVEGDPMLEKLTVAADFALAEARFGSARSHRTGMGYDVHRLVEGEALWLCGIQVPHDKGLSGHSDADVGLHALVDAILGALADGDIGSHFPPSDPQWRGAASSRFVEHARALVDKRDGIISHVDLTLICEAPRIGPHRDAMRLRIAEMLGITIDRVSVKATTTERLGFAGRGEGIAAQAIATLSLPDRF